MKLQKLLILYIFLLPFLIAQPTIAQAQSKNIKIGDKAVKNEDYYSALTAYKAAMKKNEQDNLKPAKKVAFNYNYATACRYTYLFPEAEKYYGLVANAPEKINYPTVDFDYAYTLKHNAKYAEAKIAFENFIQNNSNSKNENVKKLLPKAAQEILACQEAQVWVKHPDPNVKTKALGKNVNTQYSDFAPFEYEGDLYFSSLRFERQFQGRRDQTIPKEKFLVGKLFISKEQGTRSATPISALNVRYQSTGNATLSPDGQYIFFTHCTEDKKGHTICKIQYAKRKGRTWEKPQYLPAPVNVDGFTSTHPNIGYDSLKQTLTLFFVSNRTGGSGDMDIWRADLKSIEPLSIGEVSNLGNTINTIDADATPFFHTATQTLFFASKWHKGLGGFDLFKSKNTANGWTTPANLGIPYNSAANDIYFWLSPNDSTGYFASNRTGSQALTGESCCNDIYAITLPLALTQNPNTHWQEEDKKITEAITKASQSEPIIDSIAKEISKDTTPIIAKQEKPVLPVEVTAPIAPVVAQQEVLNPIMDKEQKVKDVNYLLPLYLYFHNDSPDPNTTKTTTAITYEQAFDSYMKLKPEYIREYTQAFASDKQAAAKAEMEKFFDDTVEGEYEKLNQCLDGILEALDMGIVLELQVRGLASPLGNNAYNKALTARRIASIRNYMSTYRNGAFREYLQNKHLIINELPMGVLSDSKASSDKGNKLSIYGIDAAKDRRIEILLVQETKK